MQHLWLYLGAIGLVIRTSIYGEFACAYWRWQLWRRHERAPWHRERIQR